jgi:hypothetical protein
MDGGKGRDKEGRILLVFVDVRADPKGMSQEELWEAWE